MNHWKAIVVALLTCCSGVMAQEARELEGTISMSGAWALYPMAVKWAEEYQKLHPKVRFDISAGGAGKGMTDVLSDAVGIGLVSREINPAELEKGAFPIAVVKDAVIPMINIKNPAYNDLMKKGAKADTLAGIWMHGNVTKWSQLTGTDIDAPIHPFTRSDACGAAETWVKYLGGKKQEDLKAKGLIAVYGDPGLGEAVRRDPLAIGYNNVNFAYDANTGKPVAGLAVLPLDVNTNGVIDKGEAFYDTQKELIAAIGRGDFPSPPARDLYFVTRGKPTSGLVVDFTLWTLKDGQKFVDSAGYISLPAEKLAAQIKRLELNP